MIAILPVLCGTAHAVEGPWTVPAGKHDVYSGLFYEHFQDYVGGDEEIQHIPTGVSEVGVKVLWAVGLAKRIDFEADVPFSRVSADDPPSGMGDFFATTTGVGAAKARLRWRFLDEYDGYPVSMALRGGLRTGFAHYDTRGRITNLGEGSTDLGPGIAVGRTGIAPGGFMNASADVHYWYRLPLSTVDGDKIPGDDVTATVTLIYAASDVFGLGAVFDGLWRLDGYDMYPPGSVPTDDVWAALDASQMKVGGKVMFFPSKYLPSTTVSVMKAVAARNNPVDTLMIDAGVGFAFGKGRSTR